MRTLPAILWTFLSFIFLSGCFRTNSSKVYVEIQGDTLKIITETKGDTIIKSFVRLDNKSNENRSDTSIYFSKPVDTTIKMSNFLFDFKQFKIYFDTAKAIAYCDSVINNTPPDKEDEGFVNWTIINSATHLKEFAKSGKPAEYVLASWDVNLLNRLNPLIIDTINKQKAKRLLIEKFRSSIEGHTSYYAITHNGDTAMVGYEQDYWNEELEEPGNKNGR